MPHLGVTVYPDLDSFENIDAYLKMASKYGFTRVFSSMFSMEGTVEEVICCFTRLIEIAHSYHMQVSLDLNPMCFERIGASYDDLSIFHQMKCDILRMDCSFGLEKDLAMINNPYGILLEFNASMDLSVIQGYIDSGVEPTKLLFCHNFYPQPFTGNTWAKFIETNEVLAAKGVRVGAFVSSHAPNTHGVWDARFGLPTVEMHRELPIDLQMRHMLATGHVTDILIGNAYATEEELKAMHDVLNVNVKQDEANPIVKMLSQWMPGLGQQEVVIKIDLEEGVTDLEKEILFDFYPHADLGDSSEWIIRSRMERFTYSKNGVPVRECSKDYFKRGDIVIVNNNYQHYSGEVQIVLRDMKNDGLRNLVGHIDENEQLLLDYTDKGVAMIFKEK